MTGAWVLLAVLTAATGFGLWRRATDGRVRDVDRPGTVAADRTGGVEPPARAGDRVGDAGPGGAAGARLTAADLGQPLGARATLVQFSSAFCQPCRATRRVLTDVTGMVDGVAHVEIDAEDRLDLVRRLDVMRTPTVLVLDASGTVRKRAAGLPRTADVIAALGTVV